MEFQKLLLVCLGFVSISGGHSQPLGDTNHVLEEIFGFEENAASSGGVRVERGVVPENGDSPEGQVIQDRQEVVDHMRNSVKAWSNGMSEPLRRLHEEYEPRFNRAMQQHENDAAAASDNEVEFLETQAQVHASELRSIKASMEAVGSQVDNQIHEVNGQEGAAIGNLFGQAVLGDAEAELVVEEGMELGAGYE